MALTTVGWASEPINEGHDAPASSKGNGPFADLYPGFDYCGAFTHSEFRYDVYARNVRCRRANRVVKAFVLPPYDSPSGWDCGSGAGGGYCPKGNREIGYQVRVK